MLDEFIVPAEVGAHVLDGSRIRDLQHSLIVVLGVSQVDGVFGSCFRDDSRFVEVILVEECGQFFGGENAWQRILPLGHHSGR